MVLCSQSYKFFLTHHHIFQKRAAQDTGYISRSVLPAHSSPLVCEQPHFTFKSARLKVICASVVMSEPPFYVLSEGQSNTFSTHDTSRASFHHKDLAAFSEDVNNVGIDDFPTTLIT
jgi:hypothetical protein